MMFVIRGPRKAEIHMTQIDPDKLKQLSFSVWNFKQGEMVSMMIHLGDRLEFN